MNDSERRLYRNPQLLTNPLLYLQEVWNLILADFNVMGISYQRAAFLAVFTIELLHQARQLNEAHASQREDVTRFLQWYPHVSTKTQGGYINQLLSQSIVNDLMMTKGNLSDYKNILETKILSLLSEWVEEVKAMNKYKAEKTPFDLWGILTQFLGKPYYDTFYDKLLFLEFVKGDIAGLVPEWMETGSGEEGKSEDIKREDINREKKQVKGEKEESGEKQVKEEKQVKGEKKEEKKEQKKQKELLHVESTVRFLASVVPRVLFNISVQSQYFPKSMTEKNPKECYDILYLNQSKHAELIKRVHFLELITSLIGNCLTCMSKLTETQQPLLLNVVMNYFYAYHIQRKETTREFLFQCFAGLSNVVRFAKFKEIMLFLTILYKLQYGELVSELLQRFAWIKEFRQKVNSSPASPRNSLDAFLPEERGISVAASDKRVQMIEIFRPYSLVYFDVSCKIADIDVNLYYAGTFDDPSEHRKLIFEKKKLKVKEEFKGSIETVQPGIYFLQFDNSYSWMTPKQVGYRIEVVAPMDIKYPFAECPYSRFLISQIHHEVVPVMLVDYDFFGEREGGVDKQGEGGCCHIKVRPSNYIIQVEQYTYQLDTDNCESALSKLVSKLKELSVKVGFKSYLVNGRAFHNVSVEKMEEILKQEIEKPFVEELPSPVEMLRDVISTQQPSTVSKQAGTSSTEVASTEATIAEYTEPSDVKKEQTETKTETEHSEKKEQQEQQVEEQVQALEQESRDIDES